MAEIVTTSKSFLTIFASPKAFVDDFDIIQRNAICSWLSLKPKPQVILLGDDAGIDKVAKEFGIRHIANVEHTKEGGPLLSDVFSKAQQASFFDILAYVNCDIILFQSFLDSVKLVYDANPTNFLMIGRRTDLTCRKQINFSIDWQSELKTLMNKCGVPHSHTGLDYQVFKKGEWDEIPDFVIGRIAWDNWFVGCALEKKMAVVDLSSDVKVIHQNHKHNQLPGGFTETRKGREAKSNRLLAKNTRLGTLLDATWRVMGNKMKKIATEKEIASCDESNANNLYHPALRYLFCVPRTRSLISQKSMIQYLNIHGITPMVALGHPSFADLLKGLDVKYVSDISNEHDILFTESAGLDGFEAACLLKSFQKGRVNLKIANSISIHKNIVNINYTPQKTQGRIHGMCGRDQRTCTHFNSFNPGLKCLNVGDPDWDATNTTLFKQEVNIIKRAYNEKLLVICVCMDDPQEYLWMDSIAAYAQLFGYGVIVHPHPGRIEQTVKYMQHFKSKLKLNINVDHHMIFAAASHLLIEINSTVVAESLRFGTKVGATPMVSHSDGYGKHVWTHTKEDWNKRTKNTVGPEIQNIVSPIIDASMLEEFLSTSSKVPIQKVDDIFGWPKVNNYCSYLFYTVDKAF